MKESEAKEKWCPMVKWCVNRWPSSERYNKKSDSCKCIASDCMMWRIIDGHVKSKDGYCGLAGNIGKY